MGTPEGGITADAIVVTLFDELKNVSDKVSGMFVVLNQDYEGYPISAAYCVLG